jgi:hypothetical protein
LDNINTYIKKQKPPLKKAAAKETTLDTIGPKEVAWKCRKQLDRQRWYVFPHMLDTYLTPYKPSQATWTARNATGAATP